MSDINRGSCGRLLLACMGLLLASTGFAQEAVIRKNIGERIPDFPAIDEVTKTAMPGLFELRVGTDLFYSDEKGDHLIRGHLIDTQSLVNLTEDRLTRLKAIDFDALPLGDAVVWRQGSGARKLVVFADPNCGYCKMLERELQEVKDLTVYVFLYPLLGPDSQEKSRNIWCSRDRSKAWLDWMRHGKNPGPMDGWCDVSVLQRNAALGRRHKINGTPGVVFEDGKFVLGAMELDQLQKQLAASKVKEGRKTAVPAGERGGE